MKSPKLASNARVPDDGGPTLKPVDYLLLTVAAFLSPLRHMAGNFWQVVHPERGLLIGAVAAAVACGAAYAISRSGRSRMGSVFPVLVALLILFKAGRLVWELPVAVGWALAILIIGIAWYLGSRLSETVLTVVSVAAVVTLSSGVILDWYSAYSNMGESSLDPVDSIDVVMAETPDIYFIIVDGYMGLVGLDEILDQDKGGTVAELESYGFQMPMSAWSAYPSTDLSVPAMLDLGYPVDLVDPNSETQRELHEVISGSNVMVENVKANGYHTTMVESGWVGSSCSVAFDRCIDSFWLDALTFAIAQDSVANRLVVNRNGHAFTANALYSMDVLRELHTEYEDNGRADFVFAHLVSPHAPYLLDPGCNIVVDGSRYVLAFTNLDYPDRGAHFVEQSECIDSFMVEFGNESSGDEVVVFVGDHGLRHHPLSTAGERPQNEAVLELMNVWLAVRMKSACILGDPILTTDLLRQVFSCYSEAAVAPVPQRMYLQGGYEMSQDEIAALIGSPTPG